MRWWFLLAVTVASTVGFFVGREWERQHVLDEYDKWRGLDRPQVTE